MDNPAPQLPSSPSPASWLRRHPDLAVLGGLLLVGGLLRLAFLFRAPAFFVGGDSQTYLLPAWELARDGDWDLGNRRPPGYPLFLAAVIGLLGEDLRAVSFVQHLLGLATIAATYGLGRLVASRAAGLLAGLAVALSGPLLIWEHYVMAEALFTALITGAALAVLGARRSGRPGLALLAGALLALGWLTRPAALPIALLVPLALLGAQPRVSRESSGLPWRRVGVLSGLAGLAFVLVAAPWVACTLQRHGTFGAYGFGNTLMWRVTREAPALIGPRDSWPSRDGDALAAARRYAFGRATRKDLPDDIADGLQARFGLTKGQADGVLMAVALEAIRARPLLYLQSTAQFTLDVFYGDEQPLGGQGKTGGVERFPNPQDKYQSWWDSRISHLPQPPTPAEAAEFSRARALAELYQPHRFGPLLLALCLAGLAAGACQPRYRGTLFLAATILVGLLSATALAASMPRFRYPFDPFISVLAATGVLALVELLRAAARHLQPLHLWRRASSVERRAPVG